MSTPMTKLAQVLLQKSETLNLFSTGDRLKLDEKHIPDSLAVLDFWKPADGSRVLDMGTGGGLPGLALAQACPSVHFLLVDSVAKKIKAVQEMANELGLSNLKPVCGRLEALAHQAKYRENFDAVTARALAELPTLLEYAAGFLKVGGFFYAWKSADFQLELGLSKEAQKVLGLQFVRAYNYTLPGGESRSILEFEKIRPLPAGYPRKEGMPKAKPLLS